MHTQPDLSQRHLHGPLRVALPAGWLVLVGLMLSAFAAGIPVRFNHLLTLSNPDGPVALADLMPLANDPVSRLDPAEAAALHTLGLSPSVYAGYILSFDLALVLTCALIGLFIFWRRPDDWMTLWVSLLLVLLGTSSVPPEIPLLATVWPGWALVASGGSALGMVSNLHILCLSPDGRFVPRWTLTITAGFTGGMLAVGGYAVAAAPSWGILLSSLFILVAIPVWVVLIGLGIYSQIYRYRRVSGPLQRQQTKWVMVGLAALTLGFVFNGYFNFLATTQSSGQVRLLLTLARAPIVNMCMLFLPVCVAFSIFRYRLWDIDLLIRRTLVYGALTALLTAVYFASVVLLQSVFRALFGQAQNAFVTVLSTLAIAALFVPLRKRLQDFIDRRFYRQKVDAAQALAAFSQAARNEVDLDRLTEELVQVVQETMQPAGTSLWLSPARGSQANDHPANR
jgi:hypothetical protein